MNLKTIIAATLTAVALISAPVVAADVVSTSAVNSPVYVSEVINFNGPYAGIGVIHSQTNGIVPVVSAGYDFRYDAFLLGGEVFATVESAPVLGVDVKAGVVLTENFAVYGLAGLQKNIATNVDSHSFGIGADYAITENVSLTGSYKQVYDFGTWNNRDDQFRVGVKVSF